MKWNIPHEASLLILVLAAVSLWSASGVWLLAVCALAFCLWIYRRLRSGKVFVLRRAALYAGIVPFAIWFAAYPNPPGGFSPLFFYIPAWYLLYLAILEWRSVGHGGKSVFVLFDALAALFLASFEWNPISAASLGIAILVFLFASRSGKSLKAWMVFWIFSILLSALAGFGIWRGMESARASWMSRAMESSGDFGMMGFSNVGKLGSFSRNYSGQREGEVVFRVYSNRMPVFFKGIAYARYLSGTGLWKKSAKFRELQTGRFVGNYGGFENGISPVDTTPAWVRSTLSLRNVLFAPSGAAAVAIKGLDSIPYFDGDFFSVDGDSPKDWYYFDGVRERDSSTLDSAWTKVPENLEGFLDSAIQILGLFPSPDSLTFNLKRMRAVFRENFTYSLSLPLSKREDPLRTFFRERSGFCEYYATLGTLMLRRMGIPARYVTGFAYPEMAAGYWIFRRRNAHAWVEFQDADGFWNAFDPTPSAARPGEYAGTSPGNLWERLKGNASLFFHELSEGAWRQTVDAFGTWTSAAFESVWFSVLAGILVLGGGLWIFARRIFRKRRENRGASAKVLRLKKLLADAEKRLAARGIVRAPGETVLAFARRVPANEKTEWALQRLAEYNAERWKF